MQGIFVELRTVEQGRRRSSSANCEMNRKGWNNVGTKTERRPYQRHARLAWLKATALPAAAAQVLPGAVWKRGNTGQAI